MLRPISGRRFGPKTISAMTRTIRIWIGEKSSTADGPYD